MDPLIRALRISGDTALTLGLRRLSAPPASRPVAEGAVPAAPARDSLAGERIPPGNPAPPEQSASVPDDAWLDSEREKIEDELRAEYEARVESALAEARSRGREEGLAIAKTESERKIAQKHEEVARVVAAVGESLEKEIVGAEDLLVGIAFEAVCRILSEGIGDRETVRAMIQQVVRRVSQEETAIVRLHPQDCALLRNGTGGDFSGEEGRVKVELVPDDEVALGGCVVETSGGYLDARLETQLQRLRDTVLEVRRSARKVAQGEP
jgi:flagellar assembly protein FliH